jgi:hypothetical protein
MGDLEFAHLLMQLQGNLTAEINRRADEHAADLRELKLRQDIANGRVGKLESAMAVARGRIRAMELGAKDSASLFSSMTKAQKARFLSLAVTLAGSASAALAKLIPVVWTFLSARLHS